MASPSPRKRTRSQTGPSPKKLKGEHDVEALRDIANRMRILSVEATTKAGSGHPSSCSSMAELLAVMFFDKTGMRFNPQDPRNINNDRFILSKGHCAPILYAAWHESGLLPREEVLKLREFGNDLEGHPTPRLSFVDLATGSLGQGLNAAAGMAYAAKHIDKRETRYWCLMGDGESAEGAVWEAMNFASFYHLDNLVAIIDINRLGQSDATPLQHHLEIYKARCEAFGWHAITVDGHNVEEIIAAYEEAGATKDKPTIVLAKTFKGHAFKNIEDQLNWHGKALGGDTDRVLTDLKAALSDGQDGKRLSVNHPTTTYESCVEIEYKLPCNYTMGQEVATRNAYGTALVDLGRADGDNNRVVAGDADVKNSTMSIGFYKAFPNKFVECFIAEQNLVGVGLGMSALGKIPFVSTFSAFFARAYDHIRMGAISLGNVKFVGSHCGVSIGEDGPSQMALEDLAMFRAIPNLTVLYPCDAVSTTKAVELAANHKGMFFIRISRPNAKVIYKNDEVFELGKFKTIRSSGSDQIAIFGGGVTTHEAIAAADKLAAEGINVRVIDMFSVKPADKETILAAAQATNGRLLTVEDHYPEGGLHETVSSVIAENGVNAKVHSLAVNEIPRSGKPNELLAHYQIDAQGIYNKVKKILG
eukprot:GILK01000740.1.p1 GENE.GILK01000740.1~~GILK01000740.1.p1  ORF type:complete len:663 (+),score=116.07 GILK01000740.1:55-1989(+)